MNFELMKKDWRFVKRMDRPFGWRIESGEETIVVQYAYAMSTEQKTREDNENGVGFPKNEQNDVREAIKFQDYVGRLMSKSPKMLEILEKVIEQTDQTKESPEWLQEAKDIVKFIK